MNKTLSIRGVVPPLLTPFTGDGQIDESALRAHVDWLIEKGVHALMPCGTTGEGPLLTTNERKRITEAVVETAGGRVPVLAHVGAISTQETIDLARHAAACSADAVSVVTPYYFRLREPALVEHYCRVAEAVPQTPVFLYNIPQNTGNTITPGVAEAVVARCPNVIGIKDSAGNLDAIAAFVHVNGGHFQVVCGSDALLSRALAVGACASVSGNANVFPELVIAIFESFWRGDREGTARAQARMDQARVAMTSSGYLGLFKRCLEMRGLRCGGMRPPMPEVPAEIVAECQAQLRELGLL